MLSGIPSSSHRKHNKLVVECARIFYQVVKFVKTAAHYHPYILKKHGYDNVFNFQSLKFSIVVLFMVKFIEQMYPFPSGRIQELTTSPSLIFVIFRFP